MGIEIRMLPEDSKVVFNSALHGRAWKVIMFIPRSTKSRLSGQIMFLLSMDV